MRSTRTRHSSFPSCVLSPPSWTDHSNRVVSIPSGVVSGHLSVYISVVKVEPSIPHPHIWVSNASSQVSDSQPPTTRDMNQSVETSRQQQSAIQASKQSTIPISRASGSAYDRPERARTSHACEPCRERKTKCDGERPSCRRCLHTGTPCHYGYGKGWRKRKYVVWLLRDSNHSTVQAQPAPTYDLDRVPT